MGPASLEKIVNAHVYYASIIGLIMRFTHRTNHGAPIPLLGFDSTQEEEEEEKIEMEDN